MLAGVAVMVLMVPVNAVIAMKTKAYQVGLCYYYPYTRIHLHYIFMFYCYNYWQVSILQPCGGLSVWSLHVLHAGCSCSCIISRICEHLCVSPVTDWERLQGASRPG